MIEHVLSPYPGKFCKLKKEAPALSASNRLSGKVLPFSLYLHFLSGLLLCILQMLLFSPVHLQFFFFSVLTV